MKSQTKESMVLILLLLAVIHRKDMVQVMPGCGALAAKPLPPFRFIKMNVHSFCSSKLKQRDMMIMKRYANRTSLHVRLNTREPQDPRKEAQGLLRVPSNPSLHSTAAAANWPWEGGREPKLK